MQMGSHRPHWHSRGGEACLAFGLRVIHPSFLEEEQRRKYVDLLTWLRSLSCGPHVHMYVGIDEFRATSPRNHCSLVAKVGP